MNHPLTAVRAAAITLHEREDALAIAEAELRAAATAARKAGHPLKAIRRASKVFRLYRLVAA